VTSLITGGWRSAREEKYAQRLEERLLQVLDELQKAKVGSWRHMGYHLTA
jgi:hypothetical protein